MSLEQLLASIPPGSPDEALARQINFDLLPAHIAVIAIEGQRSREALKKALLDVKRSEHQLRTIIDAIKDGLRTAAMKDELVALEAKKVELTADLERAPEPAPRLHPKLAEIIAGLVL